MKPTDIQSEYLRKLILENSWSPSLVTNFTSLYGYIIEPPSNYYEAYHFAYLRYFYPGYYLDMLFNQSKKTLDDELERDSRIFSLADEFHVDYYVLIALLKSAWNNSN